MYIFISLSKCSLAVLWPLDRRVCPADRPTKLEQTVALSLKIDVQPPCGPTCAADKPPRGLSALLTEHIRRTPGKATSEQALDDWANVLTDAAAITRSRHSSNAPGEGAGGAPTCDGGRGAAPVGD